jgi:hypothetical protein
VADSRASERALAHLLGALDELAAQLCAELRSEEKRWRERSGRDPAAARVAEIVGALADVFEAPSARRRASRRDTERKFDPPRTRWDTPARWRS